MVEIHLIVHDPRHPLTKLLIKDMDEHLLPLAQSGCMQNFEGSTGFREDERPLEQLPICRWPTYHHSVSDISVHPFI